MDYFIILFPRLTEKKVSFALYFFNNNDSNFISNPIFSEKWNFYQKSASKQSWRLSNIPFWHKPNMPKSIYRKLLYLELFQNSLRLLEKKNQNVEVWRRLGEVVRKKVFPQTVLETINGTKKRSQAKTERIKKLCYLFLFNFLLL